MNSTRIFVCHDLDLTDEARLEVQVLHRLRQKLQERHAEVVLYPGRASDRGFLTFFYQQLSTCQWFILFQTESAVHSLGVQSAVSIAKMQAEQKRIQAILRFIALPDEAPALPPGWSDLLTFGATVDYPRALEKLLLTISLGQETEPQTDPITSPPVALLEAAESASVSPYDRRAAYEQPLIAPPPPVADLVTGPLPALPTYRQDQALLPDPLSPAFALSSLEQTPIDSPATVLNSAPISAIDRPAKLPRRLSKGQMWLSAGLAFALLVGMLLFTVVLPLRASSTHQPGTPLASSSAAAPSPWPTANRTATAGAQAAATVSAQGTASAQASATASAQATVSAQGTASALSTATAIASTPQGLYMLTTRRTPNVFDPLSGSSSLKWDTLNYSGGGGCSYSGGSYHATMPQSGFFATCMAEASNYGDFLYQVHMIITGGSGNDGGGLIFRSAGSTAYRLHIGLDGSYDLVTPAKTLASGTSTAIKTGLNKTNLVAVAAHGSTIDIYVNGVLIINLTDTTSRAGQIGLMGVDFSSTAVKVAYTNAQIWLL